MHASAPMDIISHALAKEAPLSLPILSDLGKGSLRKALLDASSPEDVKSVVDLWPKLVVTASSPRVTDKHNTAAANALCVYLTAGVGSTISEIQHLVLSRDAWFDAFQCVHKSFNEGKTKPAFQVLDTLCDLVSKQTNAEAADMLGKASFPLVRIILLGSPRSDIKKACLMLSHLCRKTPLGQQFDHLVLTCLDENDYAWKHRLLEHNILLTEVTSLKEGSISHIFLALVLAMVDLDTRTAALKLFSSLRGGASEKPLAANHHSTAERVIALYLDRNHAAAGSFAENVLPVILDDKQKLTSFVQLYAATAQQTSSRMALFLAILKIARAKAILSEPETLDILNSAFSPPDATEYGQDMLYWCKKLLMASDSEVQILMYGLLVSSPAGNAIVSPEVLDSIALSMPYLHDHAEAHERSEILSNTRRLLRRLQNSAVALQRSIKNEDAEEVHPTLASYLSFKGRFYAFLKDELNTGVSYQRHILSLLSLQLLFDHELDRHALSVDAELVPALISLVLDPFEDVRSTASKLLQCLVCTDNSVIATALSPCFLQRARTMAIRTGRADHADASGRISALRALSCLPLQVTKTSPGESLMEQVQSLDQMTSEDAGIKLRPGCSVAVHGELLSVSYQLQFLPLSGEQIPHIATLLLRSCMNVWNQVRPQLCVDSPETATEVEDGISNEGPKDLLAYSWMAVRDSSIALQSLIAVVAPSYELFLGIGDLCMDQLISLRHRGAFSTVAQTFNQCCDKIRFSDIAVRDLVRVRWYQAALTQIDEQADRLTRRSAGLPATVTALLSPNDISLFSCAISDFMGIAQQPIDKSTSPQVEETKLPQVHALNCLKDIMTNSRFSTIVGQHLESILGLASECLSSKTWAIRNCGMMLLRACIRRLDTSTTLGSFKITNASIPKSAGNVSTAITLRLLSQNALNGEGVHKDDSSPTEHTFACLDLLAHATLDDIAIPEVLAFVTYHLSHRFWAIRDSAARLLATRLATRSQSPTEAILGMLRDSDHLNPENGLHGRFLCCRHLLDVGAEIVTESELRSIIQAMDLEIPPPIGGVMPHSTYVYAVWLDLLNDAASILLDRGLDGGLLDLRTVKSVMTALDSSKSFVSIHHSYLLQRFLLLNTFSVLMRFDDSKTQIKEMEALITRLVDNPDAMSFTLEVLRRKHCQTPCRGLPVFLINLMIDAHRRSAIPSFTLQQLFTCLAQALELSTDVPVYLVQLLLEHIEFLQHHTPRELRVAEMELLAMVLGNIEAASREPDAANGIFEDWLRLAQHSAVDEVDFPTRLGAARAVSRYIGCRQLRGLAVCGPSSRQKLLFLLYDLLNDDDEEVRLEAMEAARKFRPHKVSNMNNLGYCALATRIEVLTELQTQLAGTPELAEAALLNLVRMWNHESIGGYRCGLASLLTKSVSFRLLDMAERMNDLFAEERQNLYIDDIREIQAWTNVLHRESHTIQSHALADKILRWAAEGMTVVVKLLETYRKTRLSHEGTTDYTSMEGSVPEATEDDLFPFPESLFGHPSGITYTHEILVILIQVVSLAGVLYQHDKAAGGGRCQEMLTRVRAICSSSDVNSVLLDAVNRALGSR